MLRGVYSNELMLFNFVIFLTLAQGLNIIYGFTGYLPFGYVGFFGAGAYGFALVGDAPARARRWSRMAAGAVAALVLAVMLLPLLRLSGAYFAIANLAAAQAVYEIVANPDLEDITKGPYGVSLSEVFAPRVFLLRRAGHPGGDVAAGGVAAQLALRHGACRRSGKTRSAPRWPACPSCAAAPSPGCCRRWSPAWWAACSPGTFPCSTRTPRST